MKCSEFKVVIERIAELYVATGARSQHEQLIGLLPIFDLMPTKSVADFEKCIRLVASRPADSVDASIQPAVQILEAAEGLLARFGKPAAAKDLSTFVASLKAHQNTGIDSLIAAASAHLTGKKKSRAPLPPRNDIVSGYSKRLEQALGDDECFKQEYSKLETDKNVQANEIIALAKLFAHASVKSRPAALKKILSRHESLMVSRAKAAATGGRIAG